MLKTAEAPVRPEARTAPEPGGRARRARPARRGHQRRSALEALGPYLSERQWGTVREDYSPYGNAWEYFSARPGALARLSLGRGRHRRHQRRQSAAVPGAGALERQGPDPQGAAVRPDQRRGQPQRGRQGALLLSRCHADPQLPEVSLQISAGRVPLRLAGRGEPAARQGPARVRADRYRPVRRRPLFRRVGRVRQGSA